MGINPLQLATAKNPINLGQKLLEGLKIGQAMGAIRDKQRMQEEAQIFKEQYSNDVKAAFSNPTPKSMASLIAKYPKQREAFKEGWDILDEDRKQNELESTSKVYAALLSDNPDIAEKIIDKEIEALENAGQDASNLIGIKEYMQVDPKGAAGYAGLFLSSIMGTKDFSKTFEALEESRGSGKPKYKVLSPEEKKKLGFDKDSPLQMSPDGKISSIGGKGVSVTIEGDKKPTFGTIPPGWQVIEENGAFKMEPIPGGPAEIKAKVLAKKKEKQGTLEKRTGNVVLQDISKLENKIKKSSFFSPVTGISGYVASFVPGTRRVDSEQLKETIVANIGFDRLQQMREASPTGGALGAISERELSTLQAVMGSLAFVQSEKQLLENLDRLDGIYKDILKKASAYPGAEEFGFKSKDQQQEVTEKRTAADGRVIVKFKDGSYGVE